MNLIEITEKKYSVTIELAYASKNNFTKKKIYKNAKCFIHKSAEPFLVSAINIAQKLGYKIKIYDAFRPTEAQKILWDFHPDKNFITPPSIGSPHSRGIAIDLTLMKNSKILDMGTNFDYLHKESYHGDSNISLAAQKNRIILLGIMTTAGWDFYKNEWWHYQLFNSKKWPLINDKIEKTKIM
tara:strand:+ start:573 stop:1121 length:549 start_codon:yes stop_codon:yes gene_type:complete